MSRPELLDPRRPNESAPQFAERRRRDKITAAFIKTMRREGDVAIGPSVQDVANGRQ